jgi:hypothetical protein
MEWEKTGGKFKKGRGEYRKGKGASGSGGCARRKK